MNEYVAEYAGLHPERLIGLCPVDRRTPDALDQPEDAAQRLRLRGLQMGQIYQTVAPTDSRFR